MNDFPSTGGYEPNPVSTSLNVLFVSLIVSQSYRSRMEVLNTNRLRYNSNISGKELVQAKKLILELDHEFTNRRQLLSLENQAAYGIEIGQVVSAFGKVDMKWRSCKLVYQSILNHQK